MTKVKSHRRHIAGKLHGVHSYSRRERPASSKRVVGTKKWVFVDVRDGNGQWRGLKKVIKR